VWRRADNWLVMNDRPGYVVSSNRVNLDQLRGSGREHSSCSTTSCTACMQNMGQVLGQYHLPRVRTQHTGVIRNLRRTADVSSRKSA